jgi:hypothetical protein
MRHATAAIPSTDDPAAIPPIDFGLIEEVSNVSGKPLNLVTVISDMALDV